MREQISARGREEYGIGAANRIDGNDPTTLVDRKPQLQQRFLTAGQLGWRIGRPQLARRRQKLRTAADHRRHWDRIGKR